MIPDITSEDEDYIYTRIAKKTHSNVTPDNTLNDETFSTLTKPKSTPTSESTSAIDVQTDSKPTTHCSQIIPFSFL